MLYDRLDNLEQYTGLFENLDTCIEWIMENGLDDLPMGRTEIQGEDIYVNVMECPAAEDSAVDFETHSKYMDLQIVLDGSQLFQVPTVHTQYIHKCPSNPVLLQRNMPHEKSYAIISFHFNFNGIC